MEKRTPHSDAKTRLAAQVVNCFELLRQVSTSRSPKLSDVDWNAYESVNLPRPQVHANVQNWLKKWYTTEDDIKHQLQSHFPLEAVPTVKKEEDLEVVLLH